MSHKKTVKNWDIFTTTIEKVDVEPNANVRFLYSGKLRIGTVERIGEREDGSCVLAVETQDGPRNFDADLISELEILELI